jgi:hypothetical protein
LFSDGIGAQYHRVPPFRNPRQLADIAALAGRIAGKIVEAVRDFDPPKNPSRRAISGRNRCSSTRR